MDLMHEVRVLAFQKIYSIDINQSAMDDIFDIFTIEDKGLDIENESIKSFYSSLVNGTFNNLEYIDSLIRDISWNWSLDRMDKVDLAILRMGVYSLKFQNFENSKRALIDEAILIAKKYGSKNSDKFINGILDALLKNMENCIEKNKTLVFILLFLLSVFLGGFYFYFNPNILYFLRGEKDFSKLIIEIDFYIDKKKFS